MDRVAAPWGSSSSRLWRQASASARPGDDQQERRPGALDFDEGSASVALACATLDQRRATIVWRYVEAPTVPVGMTLDAYRRSRALPHRRRGSSARS
jgi:hypothetical protein